MLLRCVKIALKLIIKALKGPMLLRCVKFALELTNKAEKCLILARYHCA